MKEITKNRQEVPPSTVILQNTKYVRHMARNLKAQKLSMHVVRSSHAVGCKRFFVQKAFQCVCGGHIEDNNIFYVLCSTVDERLALRYHERLQVSELPG